MELTSPTSLPLTYVPRPSLKTGFSSTCVKWVPPIFPQQTGDGVGLLKILVPHCHIQTLWFLVSLLLGGSWQFHRIILSNIFCSHKLSSHCLSFTSYFGTRSSFVLPLFLPLSGVTAVITGFLCTNGLYIQPISDRHFHASNSVSVAAGSAPSLR